MTEREVLPQYPKKSGLEREKYLNSQKGDKPPQYPKKSGLERELLGGKKKLEV